MRHTSEKNMVDIEKSANSETGHDRPHKNVINMTTGNLSEAPIKNPL